MNIKINIQCSQSSRFIALNIYIRKGIKKTQVSNISSELRNQKKKNKVKPKQAGEKIKIIRENKNKTGKKSMKSKVSFGKD